MCARLADVPGRTILRPEAPAPRRTRCLASRADVSRCGMAKTARTVVDSCEGFADRQARFFRALARNQSREWFAAHRAEYEEGWLAPMKALLAEVRERIDPVFPRHPLA